MSVAHPGMAGEVEAGQLQTLYRLLAALIHINTTEDLYRAALTSLLEATAADHAAILLFDDEGRIQLEASLGRFAERQPAIEARSPWPAGSLDAQPVVEQEAVRSLAFVPLALDAGVFGEFILFYPAPHTCNAGELAIAQVIGAHVALATRHQRAELQCATNEQRLQAILDNSTAVIFLKDLQGRYLAVNRRFEELFQVDKANVLGRKDHEIFPAEIADRFSAGDRAVLDAGRPVALEEFEPLSDGLHTYIWTMFPVNAPDGSVTGVCGFATDITERKQLEVAGRRLAAIVESSEDAIISKDLNGVITSWNKGAERTFGYTADQVVGKPVSILAAPEHLDEMPAILAKIRQGDRVEHYETRRRRSDGTIIDVSLTVSPVRDAAGQIIGASKIARDISGRIHAEQERELLLAREQEARRTAELLNQIGPRLSVQLNLETLVQEVTDIATALVGAQFGSFFHNVVNEKGESYMLYALSGVPSEAFSGFPMPRSTDLFGPTFRGDGLVRCVDVTDDPRYGKNLPHRGMPDGHLPVRSYLAAPVIGRTGGVLGGLFFGHSEPGRFTANHEAILTGIAAQAAIAMDNARLFEEGLWGQAELKRSNEELRRVNRDLEVFAYSASHDLQEPLRTIAISAQLIERSLGRQGQAEGEMAKFLPNILNATKRMAVLIEDLLAYTRATKYEEGPAPIVDSASVLAEVLENLQAPIQEAKAAVTSGELPAVAIHASRLAQVLQNLISNAIKYRSQEIPHVHVTADQRDGWCVFSVADNGIGIEPQFAEQVFGLFKRLHGRDEYPGSGIGLAICQRVVEQYGGRIWLEQSSPGRGSTFCFSLPSRT